jgi:subtilisin-like proprotein convertase family protein
MRRSLVGVLAVLAGCAAAENQPDGGGPIVPDASGGGDDAAPIDGAPPIDAEVPDAMLLDAQLEARSITDDAFADFASAATTGTVVETWGAVAPVAYYTGGLLQRGSDTGYFTDGMTATWTDVAGFTSTGKNSIMWHSAANWVADTPPSVGLTDPDFWSQWFEGEIWLEAGSWTFYLLVDDHGFIEIAPPGSSSYTKVVGANWNVEGSGVFDAAAAGWHPFRYAIAEQAGSAEVTLRFAGPGVGQQPIPRHRFRARVDQIQGMVQAGFDESRGVGDVDTTIDAIGPGNTNWNTGNPGDLGMTAADAFSVRWAGQFRVDLGGTYTFRYQTDDGQRLWIDGIKVIDSWGDTVVNAVTGALNLAPGWHDLVIEQSEWVGGAAATLTVESGPELVGQALPVFRLRPVEGRAERVCPGVNHDDVAIGDLATVQSSVVVTAPPSATVTGIDLQLAYTHTYRGDMVFRLRAPSGTEVVVFDPSDSTSGSWTERFVVTGLNGQLASGTWTLVAQDAASQDTGTLLDFAVTPHFAGGDPPIPTASSFESSVRDLGTGTILSVDTLTWAERLPAGSDIAVSVRTCALPGDCAAAPWSPAVTAPGGAPAVGAARYLQYRIDFTSDGDRAPALEWLRVDYTAAL